MSGNVSDGLKDVVFCTAADAKFFRLCLGLVLSLLRAAPERPRVRILDLGLTAEQVRTLIPLVEAVLKPQWFAGASRHLPPWFAGFTARPFLPRYAGDAEIVVWLDADTWVQEWAPLANLIEDSRSGRMAIVEEKYGSDIELVHRRSDGGYQRLEVTVKSRKHNVIQCYQECFGAEVAERFGEFPSFNGGVWALRRDSPSWAVYGEILEAGLSRAVHNLVEQQALNIAIRTGKIAVSPQPSVCNFALNQDLPAFDVERKRFVSRHPPHEAIGIIHFTDLKWVSHLTLLQIPSGRTETVPIHFVDWLAAPAATV